MGTELITQERVYCGSDLLDYPTGELSVKRGSYGIKGMLVITVGSEDGHELIYLQKQQVIALIQTLAASLDYSDEGHIPHPIVWPQTEVRDYLQ